MYVNIHIIIDNVVIINTVHIINDIIINLIIIIPLIPWRQLFITSKEKRELLKNTFTAKNLAYVIKNITPFLSNSG